MGDLGSRSKRPGLMIIYMDSITFSAEAAMLDKKIPQRKIGVMKALHVAETCSSCSFITPVLTRPDPLRYCRLAVGEMADMCARCHKVHVVDHRVRRGMWGSR